MVHEALSQWRKKNCRGLAGDPALNRFLNQNLKLPTKTEVAIDMSPEAKMAIDSPFSTRSLSPLSPLLELGSLIEDCGSMDAAGSERDLLQLTSCPEPSLDDLDLGLDVEISSGELVDNSDTSSSSNEDEKENNESANSGAYSPRASKRKTTKRTTKTVRKTEKKKPVPKIRKKTVDEVFVEQPIGEARKCSCKKSKCLKLYCECFAAGVLCDHSCKCSDCQNTSDNVAARRKAVAYKLARKPKAFNEKIVETAVAKDGAVHVRGCNCKRSGCQKKYCECYQGGIACSDACKCTGCKNDGGLMHLRDLGVAGWKAPEGGFNRPAYGLMGMMVMVSECQEPQEPIPMCDSEIALQNQLTKEHLERAQKSAAFSQPAPIVPTASELKVPLWPAVQPAQSTPRSGTALEPYPEQKRQCRQNTPKSFNTSKPTEASGDADGMFVELPDISTCDELLSPKQEQLPKGIRCRAQWADGEQPGYYHSPEGKLCWGVPNPVPPSVTVADTMLNEDEVEIGDLSNISVFVDDNNSCDQETVNNSEFEDKLLQEVEASMADLLTPRMSDIFTPRMADTVVEPPLADSVWDLSSMCSPRVADWGMFSPRSMVAAC